MDARVGRYPGAPLIQDDFWKLVSELDPVNNTSDCSGKRLLMINGELDEMVPSKTNARFLESVGGCEVSLHPDAKHEFTRCMEDEICLWLSSCLLAS